MGGRRGGAIGFSLRSQSIRGRTVVWALIQACKEVGGRCWCYMAVRKLIFQPARPMKPCVSNVPMLSPLVIERSRCEEDALRVEEPSLTPPS